MEYDKKIDDRAMILNCLDVEFCKRKTFSSGYFTDDIDNYSDLSRCKYGKLTDTTKNGVHVYQKDGNDWFAFFLPDCGVKKEKKYRPYTLMEFTDKFTIGCPIKFRRKGAEGCEKYLILNGYINEKYSDQTITYINIGSGGYTLQELFEEYEWQVHYTEDFEPFGVEE